ncbi:LPS assembly lipoprotein LptE [Francisella halioticida]
MKMRKYIILIFVFLLGSCGFLHPRGVVSATSTDAGNFSSLVGTKFYIESNNHNSISNNIKRNLKAYKAIIVNDDKNADYIVNIQDVKEDTKLTSVVGGASNNTYQLYYRVTYNVVKPNNKTPVIPDNTIDAQQFWQSNSGTQLAQNYQADRIFNYLQTNTVPRIVTQIAALLPSKTPNKLSQKHTA